MPEFILHQSLSFLLYGERSLIGRGRRELGMTCFPYQVYLRSMLTAITRILGFSKACDPETEVLLNTIVSDRILRLSGEATIGSV